MKILFCNITYLKNYTGITNEDTTNKGGSWVEKNKDAHEQWNFLNQNGYCYGFVMNKGEQFAIERIDKDYSKAAEIEDVTIVWCALKKNQSNKIEETVIVGWYEHATVCRNFQDSIVTPLSGIDRMYFCRAKAEDCYLLPETSRTFKIDRASQAGKGKGFGQQNYWYAESAYARETLIPSVIDFLEANKQRRINLVQSNFEEPENIDVPLSDEEVALANNLFDSKNYYEFLPYGYRAFRFEEKADYAFYIADALCALHQYDTAIKWYQKVTEIEGKTWDIDSIFPYLYLQCEKYEESIRSAQALFAYPEASKPEIKHEIYSILSDNYYNLGNIKGAISYLDKILAESKDKALLEFTAENRNAMIALLS